MDAQEFAGAVRARRKRLGITQEELAALAGCSPRFIGALETGKASIRVDKLAAVLEVLGLELRLATRGSV